MVHINPFSSVLPPLFIHVETRVTIETRVASTHTTESQSNPKPSVSPPTFSPLCVRVHSLLQPCLTPSLNTKIYFLKNGSATPAVFTFTNLHPFEKVIEMTITLCYIIIFLSSFKTIWKAKQSKAREKLNFVFIYWSSLVVLVTRVTMEQRCVTKPSSLIIGETSYKISSSFF